MIRVPMAEAVVIVADVLTQATRADALQKRPGR